VVILWFAGCLRFGIVVVLSDGRLQATLSLSILLAAGHSGIISISIVSMSVPVVKMAVSRSIVAPVRIIITNAVLVTLSGP
jgi:hypothetical protein